MRTAKFPYDYEKPRSRGAAGHGSWKQANRLSLMMLAGGGTIVAIVVYFCLTK